MANEWEWDKEHTGRRLNYLVLDGRRVGQQTARMSMRLLFWMIYIITLLVMVFFHWGQWSALGMWGVLFLLDGILGWKVFGPPISDA